MVPNVDEKSKGLGASFKGVSDYALHDKREKGREDEAYPTTSKRVAWTSTRNLDPELSTRASVAMMIATAEHAGDLKRAAGGSSKGRKLEKPVFHYSLSWHPDERPDRVEMEQAATESLKALGAENRQALVVCHNDEPQAHVHIILNRVDPNDGLALETSNNFLKLSDWANEWERRHGKIWTPKREEKRQEREKHADRAERRAYAEQQRAAAKERAHDNKTRAASLAELGAAQKVQHREQWRDLAARDKSGRERIYRGSSAAIKDVLARHKAESKPIWAEHFRAKRKAERGFLHRERSLAGVVVNALDAAKHQQRTGQLQDRGLLSATLRNVFSDRDRERAFHEAQDMTRKQLTDRLRAIGDREIAAVKEQRTHNLAEHRQAFQSERAELISRQDGERAKVREAWRQIYDERGQRQQRRAEPGQKPYWQRDRRDNDTVRREQPKELSRVDAPRPVTRVQPPELSRKEAYAKVRREQPQELVSRKEAYLKQQTEREPELEKSKQRQEDERKRTSRRDDWSWKP